jgi:N-methylhydantoinase A
MAQAIRTLTVEKGIAPSDFALVAFGGAGPMHAAFLAAELDIPETIVPRFPGAFSAWGMLETEIRKDFASSFVQTLPTLDGPTLADVLAGQEAEAFAALAEEGIGADTGRVEHAVDLRYIGQEYTLTIGVVSAGEPRGERFAADLQDRFDRAHEARFGHSNPGAPIEFVAVRSTGLGDLGRIEVAALDGGGTLDAGAIERKRVVFGGQEVEAAIVRRDDLPVGVTLDGPAIVVEPTATTVVPPGQRLAVDRYGALVLQTTAGE